MSTEEPEQIPVVTVTADQVVAGNVARFRRAAGMTQAELGAAIGWSPANVSAAEKSADPSRERRRFDAQTLTEISLALGVPLAALFLPPPDDATAAEYRIAAVGQSWAMGEFMEAVVMIDNDDGTAQADAYRDAFNVAVNLYLSPEWAARAAAYLKGNTPDARADLAEQLRHYRDEAARQAAAWAQLADAVEAEK